MKTSAALRRTKETDMKTSAALRRTKEKLWDGVEWPRLGKNTYICYAASSCSPEVREKVVPIIGELLEPYAYLDTWLMSKHGIDTFQDRVKTQVTRHAWLDHLVQHYEAQGD